MVLLQNQIDILGIQESWEDKPITQIHNLDKYIWFGKPRLGVRLHGGVGFYIHQNLMNHIEIINDHHFQESMWIKVKGDKKTQPLFIATIYMPTKQNPLSERTESYKLLLEDYIGVKKTRSIEYIIYTLLERVYRVHEQTNKGKPRVVTLLMLLFFSFFISIYHVTLSGGSIYMVHLI